MRAERSSSAIAARAARPQRPGALHGGDALLFELGEHLEHRVLPVRGGTARTVFAGWFKAGPNFLSVLRSDVSMSASAANETAVII